MNIKKFGDFINENFNDTPESYIETALNLLKKKIDRMFDFQELEEDEGYGSEEIKTIQQAKDDSRKKEEMTFKDLGVRLESSEISKYSKMYDSLTVKFSDNSATYNLYIMIELKEALPKDKETDFSHEDIEKCFIKFKKYNIDSFDILGQITKNVKIKNIDEDFLINLKIELDEKFSEDDEEFKIETE
jgi:hypothetical protein